MNKETFGIFGSTFGALFATAFAGAAATIFYGLKKAVSITNPASAANHAARIQGLSKRLNQSILFSARFANFFEGNLLSLGNHSLRGTGRDQEIFTLC
ncbi:MAG TPA: hypothetical protein ENI69_10275 [Rhodospirillales bacterium]|nr:hypothetical protein [Rhodospirillales bacterium]